MADCKDIPRLIERLRDRYSKHSQELRDEAADALEAKDKRIAELEAAIKDWVDKQPVENTDHPLVKALKGDNDETG